MQRHQILHHRVGVIRLVDAALLTAQRHQLRQHPEIDAVLVALQRLLLRVLHGVNERLVQYAVVGADPQGLAHEIQQLFPGCAGRIRQIRLLQRQVRRVHMAGDLNGQLVLALEIVIDVAHGAARLLGDLLHGDIFKALPVKQVQRHVLYPAAHLQRLLLARGEFFRHISLTS